MNTDSIQKEKTKFSRDLGWTLQSFFFLGISGILLNVVIGRFYGASVLGYFNLVFAFYIVISQFAVLGVWFSVLRHISEEIHNRSESNRIISSAIAITFLVAFAVCLVSYFAIPVINQVFSSEKLVFGWRIILPGLWCYSVNKVLLAVLNGKRNIKVFALSQTARYVLMIISLSVFYLLEFEAKYIPFVLAFPEVPLFLILMVYCKKYYSIVLPGNWEGWGRRHLNFGFKAAFSGTITELNTRVDVLMIGIFLGDKSIGIYSMASLVFEGISQMSVVLRDNINPLISQFYSNNELSNLKELLKKSIRSFYLLMIPVCLSAVLLFPYIISVLTGGDEFSDSTMPFGILIFGLLISSGYLPINMLLVQTGFPGYHTFLKVFVVISNLILNTLFIPRFGIAGAATATAISYIVSAVIIKYLAKKLIQIGI